MTYFVARSAEVAYPRSQVSFYRIIGPLVNSNVRLVEVQKENGCQIFFDGDQPTKEVPPGTCFLGPVQYDGTFRGKVLNH